VPIAATQAPLHSFVLEDTAMVFKLLAGAGDRAEVRYTLDAINGAPEALGDAEMSFLETYDQTPVKSCSTCEMDGHRVRCPSPLVRV